VRIPSSMPIPPLRTTTTASVRPSISWQVVFTKGVLISFSASGRSRVAS